MRLQAPILWAGRQLAACEVGGDPFVVSFDDQAQTGPLSPGQARHLRQYSGIPLTVVPEASVAATEGTIGPARRSASRKKA